MSNQFGLLSLSLLALLLPHAAAEDDTLCPDGTTAQAGTCAAPAAVQCELLSEDTCAGFGEEWELSITSTIPGEVSVVRCNNLNQVLPEGTTPVNSSLHIHNDFKPLTEVNCVVFVKAEHGMERATCKATTCPPIGRLTAQLRSDLRDLHHASIMGVSHMTFSLVECARLGKGELPTFENCYRRQDTVKTYTVPATLLKFKRDDQLEPLDFENPQSGNHFETSFLTVIGKQKICVLYENYTFYEGGQDGKKPRIKVCNSNELASCGDPKIMEDCGKNAIKADRNDQLRRVRKSLNMDKNLRDRLTLDNVATDGYQLCPHQTAIEVAGNYAHYHWRGRVFSGEKPILCPRPRGLGESHEDPRTKQLAPPICVDANDHDILRGKVMNQNKGSFLCLDDPALLVGGSPSPFQYESLPKQVAFGDVYEVKSDGAHRKTAECPWRDDMDKYFLEIYCDERLTRLCEY